MVRTLTTRTVVIAGAPRDPLDSGSTSCMIAPTEEGIKDRVAKRYWVVVKRAGGSWRRKIRSAMVSCIGHDFAIDDTSRTGLTE